MSYKIKLGSFSKLANSTKQPTTTSWADYDVTLKNGCDLLDPEVTLSISEATIAGYNYATMFGKYYFIADKYMLRENLCVLQLRHDPMATYKSQIGSATLYVLRSASQKDGNIRDTFYPLKANSTKYHENQVYGVVSGYSSGYIVLNLTGQGTVGGTTLVVMDNMAEFGDLLQDIYAEINGWQASDVIQKLCLRFGGNPQALLNGAMWFPYAMTMDPLDYIYLGSYGTSYQGHVVTNPTFDIPAYTYAINKHPKASARGQYLNLQPYTNYYLGVPGAGVFQLDSSRLIGETQIDVDEKVDGISGQSIGLVKAHTSGQVLVKFSRQIGIPLRIGSQDNSQSLANSALTSVMGLATAAATGGATLAGAATAGIGLINEAIGGTGSSSAFGANISAVCTPGWLDTVCYDVSDDDNTEHGKPLCQNKQISTLSGFIQVSEGNVAIPGTITEQQEIKAILESGFFYE